MSGALYHYERICGVFGKYRTHRFHAPERNRDTPENELCSDGPRTPHVTPELRGTWRAMYRDLRDPFETDPDGFPGDPENRAQKTSPRSPGHKSGKPA